MRLVPWWARDGWDVAASALGMSLPELTNHPHAHYWRHAGLVKARGDAARQRVADENSQ